MSRNDQKFSLRRQTTILLLCIMIGTIFLFAACGNDNSTGNGPSNTPNNPASNSNTQQRPDPCSLIKANQVQQAIPGSQFPGPTPGGNLAQGGIESNCSFTDANGVSVTLVIDPAEPTWGGIKALQSNNPSSIPTVKNTGDDALIYGGALYVLKGDYLLQVRITNYNSGTSDDTLQKEEKQIAQEALKNW